MTIFTSYVGLPEANHVNHLMHTHPFLSFAVYFFTTNFPAAWVVQRCSKTHRRKDGEPRDGFLPELGVPSRPGKVCSFPGSHGRDGYLLLKKNRTIEVMAREIVWLLVDLLLSG